MSEAAQRQWDLKFDDQRQIHLKRDDPEPFPNKKVIGRGGYGVVYEITLGGVALALKTTYTRKVTEDTLREIDVLRHVSKDRHQHIVALVGSYLYTEKRRGQFDIGLVIWPVARCDLKHFLAELEVLARHDESTPLSHDHDEEITSAIHTVSATVHTEEISLVSQLHHQAVGRLAACFGCVANAISWLHETARVRHRDLKPAQVLLSRDGLWLTDFGMSTLITDLDNSATSGAERMTMRYKAPERQQGLPRGRAEDVFALGCIYLEMSYVLIGRSVNDISIEDRVDEWSYEGSVVNYLQAWLEPLANTMYSTQSSDLSGLLRDMLSYDPEHRPTIGTVVSHLAGWSKTPFDFFGTCCTTVTTKTENPATTKPSADEMINATHESLTVYDRPVNRSGISTPYTLSPTSILRGTSCSLPATQARAQRPQQSQTWITARIEEAFVPQPYQPSPDLSYQVQHYAPDPMWFESDEILAGSTTPWIDYPPAFTLDQDAYEAYDNPQFLHTQDMTFDVTAASEAQAESFRNTGGDFPTGDDSAEADVAMLDINYARTLPDINVDGLLWSASSRYHGDATMSASGYDMDSAKLEDHKRTSPSPGSTDTDTILVSDPFECSECDREFFGKYRRGNLFRHMKMQHSKVSVRHACEVEGCSKVFQRRDALTYHYRRRHPNHNSAVAPSRVVPAA